jgi:NTP pyrophosphatase (non-canonical NTP hydrolase)
MSGMSKDMLGLVEEFQEKFGLIYRGPPRDIEPYELSASRIDHMDEELREYMRAWQDHDLEKMLDALVDLTYVVLGTALMHGFNMREAFRRVHLANMKKVRAEPEKGRHPWDVVKPDGWEPPDLRDLVENPYND